MLKQIFTAILILWMCGLVSANPNVITRDLKIYKVDTPPVIDGSASDRCWQNASCAKGFMLIMQEGKKAKEATETYICYDAENLYLLWKVYEGNMPGLKSGPPPDVNDKIEDHEAVYFYLNPKKSLEGYFCFAASPMGAKQDQKCDYSHGGEPGFGFNSSWKVKSGRFAGGWTVEMAIPFTALQRDGEFAETPSPGETWSFNLCRHRAQGEASQYSLTAGCEYNYGCFGTLTFEGDATKPVINGEKAQLFFGGNILKFKTQNLSKQGAFNLQVFNNNKLVNEFVAANPQNCSFAVHIPHGGQWRFESKYVEKGKVWYCGSMETELPDIINNIKNINDKLKSVQGKNNQQDSDVKTYAKLQELDLLIKDIAFVLTENQNAFTKQQWQTVNSVYQKINSVWCQIEFNVFLLGLVQKNTKGDSGFAVKTAPLDAKIYPKKVPDAKLSDSVDLTLAGNETRSAQLLVIPFKNGLQQANVSLTNLNCGSKIIASDNIKWHLEEYVKTEVPGQKEPSNEPDLLLPGKAFKAAPGEIKVLLVDIYIPGGTMAGEYTGVIKVENGTQAVQIPVRVKVLDFSLPEKCSVRHNHWLTAPIFGNVRVRPHIYELAMQLLSSYRSQAFYFDARTLQSLIKIYYEKDGTFSFDFSALDDYFRIGKKYNANAYWSAMTCGIGAMTPFIDPNTSIIERSTGKTITSKDIPEMKKWQDKYSQGKPEFEKNPELALILATEEQNSKIFFDTNIMYKAYLKCLVAYLKKQDVNQCSYFEIYDEAPQLESRWVEMVRHHRFLREYVPELRLFNFEVNPCQNIVGKSAIGLADAWAPQLFQCDDENMLRAIYDRRKSFGEEFWFYVCSDKSGGLGKYTPYTWRYRPNIGVRIIPWFAWRLKVDGFHVNSFEYQELVVYKNGKLLPTLRLSLLRDGMEDYEYFAILSKLVKQIDAKKHSAFIARAEKALEIEKAIIADIYEWTKSAEELDRKRLELADLIIEANKIIKQ